MGGAGIFYYDRCMAQEPRRQSDRDALELLRDERDRALETLRLIEEEGWTHYEAEGPGDTLRDVTAKRANRQRQIIERMDRLIAGFEARPGQPA
jgi:hypothetical protein